MTDEDKTRLRYFIDGLGHRWGGSGGYVAIRVLRRPALLPLTDNARATLTWAVIAVCWLVLILLLWGLDMEAATPPAAADDSPYDQQLHQGATAPADNLDGCVVADLEQACVAIPAAMFITVRQVAECESRWNPAAVGKLGERGALQLHPIHREPMRKAGLDYGKETDRWKWTVRIWEGHGWAAWSCRPR